jgi:Na+-transporting NADH:ubiquinone oxidoreductase subunit C
MSNATRTITFSVVLCLVCSVLLTAASTGLKPLQQRNIELDRQKNILKAFGLLAEGEEINNEGVASRYAASVQGLWVNDSGRILDQQTHRPGDLPLYLHVEDGRVRAYVVPIDTRGLWGQIRGYLAIANDGATILGFTVFQHQETPGLGGEIESRWFRKSFEGKKILNSAGDFVSIQIAKSGATETLPPEKRINYVDGISGATMTGKFLSEGLARILTAYEPVAIQFRQKGGPGAIAR